mgnify:CR=1 FL=1
MGGKLAEYVCVAVIVCRCFSVGCQTSGLPPCGYWRLCFRRGRGRHALLHRGTDVGTPEGGDNPHRYPQHGTGDANIIQVHVHVPGRTGRVWRYRHHVLQPLGRAHQGLPDGKDGIKSCYIIIYYKTSLRTSACRDVL